MSAKGSGSDTLKEEIKLHTELIRILSFAMLADITGLMSIFLTYGHRPVETVLILFGIFTNFMLAITFTIQLYKVFLKIKSLKAYDNT